MSVAFLPQTASPYLSPNFGAVFPHAQPPLGGDTSRVTIAPKGDSVAPNSIIHAQQCNSTNLLPTNFFSPLGL